MNNLFSNPIVIVILAAGVLLTLAFVYLLSRKGVRQPAGPDKFEQLYRKISEDIKYAVSPKFVELSLGVNDLIDLAVEVWRMEQRIAKSASSLPENQLKGLENSVQKLRRYLEKYDIPHSTSKCNTLVPVGFRRSKIPEALHGTMIHLILNRS